MKNHFMTSNETDLNQKIHKLLFERWDSFLHLYEYKYMICYYHIQYEHMDLVLISMVVVFTSTSSGGLPTWVMMNPSSMFFGVESTCPTTAIDCFDELTRKIWRSKQPELKRSLDSTSGIRACALRNFDLEVMELENTQNNALAKLPMLKLGEYEMWEIRIKQYFQIQDYALWEVIENENSWVPIPVTSPSKTGTSTGTKMTVPSTARRKINTADGQSC
ncbi:hypothetical protein Tco_1300886 [Tanacetum coccineum]